MHRFRVELRTSPFRLRAVMLAAAALLMGLAALVLALTHRPSEPMLVPLPSASAQEPEWPPGFVELRDELPLPSASTTPVSSSAVPIRSE